MPDRCLTLIASELAAGDRDGHRKRGRKQT
jgi:hypothetical protein